MLAQFSEILLKITTNSVESSTQSHYDKIIPFKVKMNMYILNLEAKIDVESVDNWVQQMESYYSVNQLSKAENITIASLNMSTSVHCWWENLSTKMEKEGGPIDTWVKFDEHIWKELYPSKYIEQ